MPVYLKNTWVEYAQFLDLLYIVKLGFKMYHSVRCIDYIVMILSIIIEICKKSSFKKA